MRRIAAVFLFFMAFQMEIRVRASGGLLEKPESCIQKKINNCAIHVVGAAFHKTNSEFKIHGAEGSTLMRIQEKEWRLISGALWVEKAEDFDVQTPYAMIHGYSGEFWVIQKKDKIFIRNIDAAISVSLTDGRKVELPVGFEFWVGRINSDGLTEFGMIQPIDFKDHLVLWNALYTGSKSKFLKDVKALKEKSAESIEAGARIYQIATERKLAAEAEEEVRKVEIKNQETSKKAQVRRYFYKRTFER